MKSPNDATMLSPTQDAIHQRHTRLEAEVLREAVRSEVCAGGLMADEEQ